ncbi:MAG: hypothetical protein WD708_08935 [Kiritimatiellia bacterium]
MLPYSPDKASSWHVKSRAHRCASCGEDFTEGETVMSRLMLVRGEMVREDFKCSEWSPEQQEQALFHWKTRFRLPPPKKEAPFKEENAEEILREMLENPDPLDVNTLFILAVMLERKRVLIEQGVQRDAEGRQVRIYEHKESGESFLIQDPELSLEDIGDVQEEVALKLGWIQPVVPGEAAESVESEETPTGEGEGEGAGEDEGEETTTDVLLDDVEMTENMMNSTANERE